MSKRTVLIDVATAGASGDMFLSALIDFIGDDESIVPVAASLLIYDPTIRVKILPMSSHGLVGKRLEVTRDKGTRFEPKALMKIIKSVSEELELSRKATTFAMDALDQLLQAEVRAHETPLEELHLHETGSVDTVLDLVGTAYLLEKAGLLGEATFIATSVAVGSGSIQTEHGLLEVPVPAVAEIIVHNEIPFLTGDAATEVLTPTGAAILATLAQEYVETSEGFTIEKQGVGFGTRDLGEIPNAMRFSLGIMDLPDKPKKPSKPAKKDESTKKEEPAITTPTKPKTAKEIVKVSEDWDKDEVVVIEANVDDIDGEVLGNLFDILLSEHLAYDVVMIPAYGKKNRPCYVIKVVAAKAGLSSVADLMIKHIGTLGIRYTEWSRLKAVRETIVCRLEVDDQEFMVRVKIARGRDGSIINIKPEADDVLTVSKATGIPIRELKPRIVLQAHAVTE
ncbi:MAG: nickel pincer cofactor biosynthesis protein LarC [Candidatus Thorarchaeota archaeon]